MFKKLFAAINADDFSVDISDHFELTNRHRGDDIYEANFVGDGYEFAFNSYIIYADFEIFQTRIDHPDTCDSQGGETYHASTTVTSDFEAFFVTDDDDLLPIDLTPLQYSKVLQLLERKIISSLN